MGSRQPNWPGSDGKGERCRRTALQRSGNAAAGVAVYALLDVAEFIMTRKMMLGIKARAGTSLERAL